MRLRWVLLLLSLSAVNIWPAAISITLRRDRRPSGDVGVRPQPGDVDLGFRRNEQGTRKGLSANLEDSPVLARLRDMAWQDWAVPIQILLGLSLIATALVQVPHEETSRRTKFQAACTISAECDPDAH
jgi:hypothetical protein